MNDEEYTARLCANMSETLSAKGISDERVVAWVQTGSFVDGEIEAIVAEALRQEFLYLAMPWLREKG